ncbi:MAG: hypothetical protein IT384_15860 [Deltaproteobacteria bacterium]|nr:hypothetical protein [Deltaproteobacteria bacterium]
MARRPWGLAMLLLGACASAPGGTAPVLATVAPSGVALDASCAVGTMLEGEPREVTASLLEKEIRYALALDAQRDARRRDVSPAMLSVERVDVLCKGRPAGRDLRVTRAQLVARYLLRDARSGVLLFRGESVEEVQLLPGDRVPWEVGLRHLGRSIAQSRLGEPHARREATLAMGSVDRSGSRPRPPGRSAAGRAR